MRRFLVPLALMSLLGATHAAANPPENRGKSASAQSNQHDAGDHHGGDAGMARITIDIGTARQWATDYRLNGQQALPPGIRKNLARGKPLPPGIAKKMLPTPYLSRLPVYPGYEWGMVGSDLVLIQAASGLIADVLAGAFD
jgi:Ni/Co efflux regulator RcnB